MFFVVREELFKDGTEFVLNLDQLIGFSKVDRATDDEDVTEFEIALVYPQVRESLVMRNELARDEVYNAMKASVGILAALKKKASKKKAKKASKIVAKVAKKAAKRKAA